MIYVNGVQFLPDSSSGHDMVIALLEHPDLVSASRTFCAIPERKFSSVSEEPVQAKCVYMFQREYATVDPALVEIVGTDEATTCVGMVIRNCRTGMTCVGHLDSPDVVVIGLFQMMSLLSGREDDNILDVHIVGAFEDSAPQVETSSGSVIPASFDASTRGPDDIIRRIRLNASFEDPSCAGRSMRLVGNANLMRYRSDQEILFSTSTSPSAEGPDYVANQKRVWEYLIRHPSWKQVFPSKLARVFERVGNTSWEGKESAMNSNIRPMIFAKKTSRRHMPPIYIPACKQTRRQGHYVSFQPRPSKAEVARGTTPVLWV